MRPSSYFANETFVPFINDKIKYDTFSLILLWNLRVRCRVDVCRVDSVSGMLSTANDSTYCTKAEPKTSTQEEENHKYPQTNPSDKTFNPIETFFIIMHNAIDCAVHPM